MSDIYLSLTETPTVVTLSQPVISGALSSTVTVANTVTVALDANSLSALENVTVTVGAAVSVSNFPSIQTVAGTVTANVGSVFGFNEIYLADADNDARFSSSYPFPISGTVTANGGDFAVSPFGQQPPSKLVAVGGYDAANDEIRLIPLSEGADRVRVEAFIVNGQNSAPVTAGNPFQISGTVTVGNSVTIGSLPAISGTVTIGAVNTSVTVAQIQGTSVTTSNFTSTTASTTLVSANSARRGLTVFNEGAGNLHICAGTTATTAAYQVRLSAGDYWECPTWQTALTHSAQFSSAGTARVTEII